MTKWLLALTLVLGGCARGRRGSVEACDKFLEKYQQCMLKAGPEHRAEIDKYIAERRAAFAEKARTPAGREQLVHQCSLLFDSVVLSCR